MQIFLKAVTKSLMSPIFISFTKIFMKSENVTVIHSITKNNNKGNLDKIGKGDAHLPYCSLNKIYHNNNDK